MPSSARQRKFTGGALRRKKQGVPVASLPAVAIEGSPLSPVRKKAVGNPMRYGMRYVGGMCFMNDHK